MFHLSRINLKASQVGRTFFYLNMSTSFPVLRQIPYKSILREFTQSQRWQWEVIQGVSFHSPFLWGWSKWNYPSKIWTVVLEKTLESHLDSKKIQPVNPKEISPEYSLEGLMLKLQSFGHLMGRINSLEKTLMLGKIKGKQRRGRQRMRWLDSIIGSVDMNLSKHWKIVKDREAWHTVVHGVAKS